MDETTTNPEVSPFHRGEQAVQQRLGVRAKIEASGGRFIRREMTEQHRAFFSLLPFLLVATVDGQGRPWASILAGSPGFAYSPDPRRLRIAARPLPGDPLSQAVHEGAPIGLLGIQLETRRRNRLSGKVSHVDDDGVVVAVDQAFGNCPQYIQSRATTFVADEDVTKPTPIIHRAGGLDDDARALIARADTLFIASVFAEDDGDPTQGADVSHRGGRPGFVRVDGDGTLTFPDYSGNLQFNTIGNLVLNPRAGLVFVDFETGDVLQLTGRTEIIWEGAEVQAFTGAERLICFRTDEMIRIAGALPLRFAFGDFSPSLEATGTWQEAAEALTADREHEAWIAHKVFDVQRESETISSFYLRRADGKALAAYRAGQFLPIRLKLPGEAQPLLRTYTLSDAPGTDHYRLSIKREAEGRVSRFLHDNAHPGFSLEAMAPRGTFVCDEASVRPIVLISGGVGITPMIAIANHLIGEGRRTGTFRRIYFIHGTRNGQTLAFGSHLRSLALENRSFKLHIRFSQPSADDHPGETHDSVGHIDIDLLKHTLPFDDFEFFLCGPADFMRSLYAGLTGLGVRTERIHYESFGPATVLKPEGAAPPSTASEAGRTIKVRFAHSNIDAAWSPEKGTLLELAEAAGLSPPFSCRSGICGTCATRLVCGSVDYVDEPVAPHADDEVLICSARPRSTSNDQECGNDEGVVLDL